MTASTLSYTALHFLLVHNQTVRGTRTYSTQDGQLAGGLVSRGSRDQFRN
jgi:hypothetical protein